MEKDAPTLLLTHEVAEILRTRPNTVTRMARRGLLPAVRLTPGGPWRYDRAKLERLCEREDARVR